MRIYRLVAVICVLSFLLRISDEQVRSSGGWSAQTGDVLVTWGELWSEDAKHGSDDHSWLRLALIDDSKLYAEYHVWKFSSTNPDAILDDFSSRFRVNAYEHPVITQNFSFGASNVFPRVIEFSNPIGESTKEYLTPSALVGGYSMVAVFRRPVAYDMGTQPGIFDDIMVYASYDRLDPLGAGSALSVTATATLSVPPGDCSAWAAWSETALEWLDQMEDSIAALETYEGMSEYPVPGISLGAMNVYDDMESVVQFFSGAVAPVWADSLQLRIAAASGTVAEAASLIFSGASSSPTNFALVDDGINKAQGVVTIVEGFRLEIEQISLKCSQ